MSDDRIRDLLADSVADVEPRHALDDIRARTRPSSRGSWLPVGLAALATAAAVTAFATLGGGPTEEPGPVATPTPSPSATATPSPSPTAPPATPGLVVAVYYVGDTPDGPRLYREFRPGTGDPSSAAADLLAETPDDPDYRTLWPAGAIVDTAFDGVGADGLAQVTLADTSYAERPAGMSEAEATMAVEQVVYTMQAAVGSRAPVGFYLPDGNPLTTVFGVPTNEPVANGPALGTLAHVSITDPAEGAAVPADGQLQVSGVANSFEANVVVRVQRYEGTEIVAQQPITAEGWQAEKLFSFTGTLDLSGVEPGRYLLMASTDDPSGQGRFHTDTRTIVVE
jgi:hypothetical protein